MKSRLTIIIAALVIAGLVACIAWALGFFEPRYGGVPASTYLRNIISQNRFGAEADKEKILAVAPRVGVPILIRFTQAQDPRWQGWYQRLYPKLPQFITRRLGPPKSNADMVLKSIRALGYYGADAHSAVPQLLKLEAEANAKALQYSPFIQQAAVDALGSIGPSASNAIPTLIARLQPRPSIGGVATAMAKIDPRGERTGAILTSVVSGYYYLGNALYTEPLDALTAMAANEPKWTLEIWRATENALNSELIVAFVSRGAASLHRLNALDAARVKVVCSHAGRSEPAVRQSIALALAFATDHANATMPVLLKFRSDTNAYVSTAACHSLLRYAQSTNVDVHLRVTAIRSVLSCGDDGNKWQALAAVEKLGPSATPALGEIVPLLSDQNERIRGKAAQAIAAVKPAATWAKSALEAARDDRWGFVREAVEAALRDIASESSSK